MNGKFTKDDIVFRACEVIVRLFRNQVEEGRACVHTRIFNYVLHPEKDFVHYGISESVTDETKNHPEHVVPCAVLVNEVFRLIKEGNLSDTEIAKLLQKHWKIVTITKDEAKQLDSKFKSKMPEGWSFENGDTFRRLTDQGIAFNTVSSN